MRRVHKQLAAGSNHASGGGSYAAAPVGVTIGRGVVYEATTDSAESVILNFGGGAEGGVPYCTLMQASDGSFYGTTSAGGANGVGALFGSAPR